MASFVQERELVQSYAKEYAFNANTTSNSRAVTLAINSALAGLSKNQQLQMMKLLEGDDVHNIKNAAVRDALIDINTNFYGTASLDVLSAVDTMKVSTTDAAATVSAFSESIDKRFDDISIIARFTTSL